jgi:hypothetical protein
MSNSGRTSPMVIHAIKTVWLFFKAEELEL